MDFSKLSSNEKLATYGAVVVFVLGLVSAWGETFFISILAALAMLAIIFLPQFAPNVRLPGSKGSLMVAAGGIAAVFGVLEVLRYIEYIGRTFGRFGTIFFLVAVAGAVVMAWAGWQAFKAEGGKFNVGMAGGGSGAPAGAAPPPAAPPPAAPFPAAPPPAALPPAAPMDSPPPISGDDSGDDRRS
jgi:hypothetical protein